MSDKNFLKKRCRRLYRRAPFFDVVLVFAVAAKVLSSATDVSAADKNTANPHSAIAWPVVYPQPRPPWPVVYPDDTVSILLAGDTGFGGHRQPVRDGHGMRHGRAIPFQQMSAGIADLMTADAAFANIETVITAHNRLRPAGKRFVFRSHPSGLKHLTDLGFNLFSTSNNHVGDFGQAGVVETLAHLDALKKDGATFAAAGLGRDRRHAATPKHLRIKNADLYLSAVGIGSGLANRPGQKPRSGHLHLRNQNDVRDALDGLKATRNGYRMLSVHYGEEGQIYPSTRDIKMLRDKVVREHDIDLVIGHHAHVARGIQRVDGKIVVYGLGNFLHPGMQNMGRFNACRDFGLVLRVHIGRVSATRYRAMAIEAIPITDMHERPKRLTPAQSKERIAVLNGLAQQLDHPKFGAQGVRFRALADGRGVACFDGFEHHQGTIANLCARPTGRPAHPTRVEAGFVAPRSCGRRSLRTVQYRKKRPVRRKPKQNYFNPFGF